MMDGGQPPPSGTSADLFDWALLADVGGFVRNALVRHWLLASLVLLGCLGLALGAVRWLPRTWYTEARLLTERNLLIASLVNPARTVPKEEYDAPTRTAYEQILREDNLEALVRAARLVEDWEGTRSAPQRLKDTLRGWLGRAPLSEEDKRAAMVGNLQRAMTVKAHNNGTVTIGVAWPHPGQALRLVETAQQNFLTARHAAEVSAIGEAIAILEGQVRLEEATIKTAIAELEDAVRRAEARRERKERQDPVGATRRAKRLLRTNQELAQLRFMLEARRRTISDMEAFWERRLTELRAQLAEQRSLYSPMHPALAETARRLESLEQEPSQLQALRKEETALAEEFLRRGGRDMETVLPSALGFLTEEPLAGALLGTADDPEVAVATDRLRMVVARHQEMLRRLGAARVEMEISKASFKHRYSVLNSAALPRAPVKPKPKLLLVGGTVAGLALALFAAVARDVLGRRLLERWQVERLLGLPVLAELSAPSRRHRG